MGLPPERRTEGRVYAKEEHMDQTVFLNFERGAIFFVSCLAQPTLCLVFEQLSYT